MHPRKIEFTKDVSGRGFTYVKGEVIDLPASLADYWIAEGFAKEYEPKQQKVVVQEVKAVRQPVKTTKRPVKK